MKESRAETNEPQNVLFNVADNHISNNNGTH